MTSFLKLFVNKVTGKSSHTRVSHIEGAERVCVDSSVLCCPVCYEVYSSVPSLLGCGHTFCGRCVRTMQVNRMVEETAKDSVIDCPLCRVSISANEVFKNYLVDDLLRSVEEIGERESKKNAAPTTEIVATLRLAKDRAVKKVAHLELRNSNLDKELQATKKQLRLMNLILFSAVMGYLALELFIGLINLLSWCRSSSDSSTISPARSSDTRVSHIEGAERVCVDSRYSVGLSAMRSTPLSSVPSLLGCGHTFCGQCVRAMQAIRIDEVFNCPLCQALISSKEVFKNYVVDDLLSSVQEIADRESKKIATSTAEIVASLRLAKDRSEKKVAHLESTNSKLDRELRATKKQLRSLNLIIFSAVLGFVALTIARRPSSS